MIVTDTAAAEAPAESVPPEAAAAPAPEAELETEVNKSARERVIDHLTDSEGPQSVEQILAGTGLNRNACEQAIFRAKKAEQIIWVAPGVYALAPPKPPPRSLRGHTDDEWIARIKAWQANPASWKIEEDGPPPNNPNHRIPQDVVGQFKDRQKREREKAAKQDAEAAAARQAAADRQLRDQLLAATGGNYTPGPALDDVAPIKMRWRLSRPMTSCPPSEARPTANSTRAMSRRAVGVIRGCSKPSRNIIADSLLCRAWCTRGRPQERRRRRRRAR